MSIRQIGTSYEAYVTHGKGERYRRRFTSQAAAIEWHDRLKADLKVGKKPSEAFLKGTELSSVWTLQYAFDSKWATEWQGTDGAQSALKNSSACLDFFGPLCSVDAITSERVTEFIKYLRTERNNSSSTVNGKLSALSQILKHAVDNGRLAALPKIKRQKLPPPRNIFIEREVFPHMVRTALQWGAEDLADVMVLGVDTGRRSGNLLEMEGRHIINGHHVLPAALTKSGRNHSIKLTQRASEVVQRRMERYGKGRLFPSLNYRPTADLFGRLCEHHGIDLTTERIKLHILRHTFGSWLAQKGVSLVAIKDLMDHSTIEVTMRYAHLCPTNYEAAIATLEQD